MTTQNAMTPQDIQAGGSPPLPDLGSRLWDLIYPNGWNGAPRSLEPIEHNPFGLEPVEHDPFSQSATPINHDPFKESP